jgi:hypothetical protein
MSKPGAVQYELSLGSTASDEPVTFRSRRTRVVPPSPKQAGGPKVQWGPEPYGSGDEPPSREADPELWAVYDALVSLDRLGVRTAYALRESFDQIYDGQRTGRWDYSQLMKTEKTHLGTLVEIWLQREFMFKDGNELDYSIAGVDVDAKWSRNLYEWEFPLEMYSRGNKVAIVVWANEATARWAIGLIRVSDDVLLPLGRQRDQKRRLNVFGKDRILWVHRDMSMIRNALMHLPSESVTRIFAARSGQRAVEELFREAQGRLINRATITTVAQQVDAAKRVRDARLKLREEGIVILGHYQPHPLLAEQLNLPVPTLGSFVSARLVPASGGDSHGAIYIAGSAWRVAQVGEAVVMAPELPKQGK